MLGVGDYLWRLIPANPILLRVVEGGGKRRRDLFIRCTYLGLLVVVVIFSLMTSDSTIGGASLADLAKESSKIFERMSFLQLGLVALLAPIFTAGAITQEKDSQTYDILLSTPMTNGQIVLGSLLSRLFFVVALLISGIPIFSITQIFGGVAIKSIVLSFLIAAATAFVTGALAMAIAVFKVGTRRTIFSFYLFIVLYLVGLWLLDQLTFFKIPLDNVGTLSKTSWLTGLHPFLALRVTFNDPEYIPPAFGDLPENLRYWPVGWYLSNPASAYATLMFFISFVLVIPSIVLLRKLAQSTSTLQTWVLQKLKISKGDRTKKPRSVWSNPIAWREAKTKASATKTSVLRYAFMALGVAGAVFIVVLFSRIEEPKNYITSDSYSQLARTLSVYSGDKAVTYNTARNTQVSINKREATFNDLHGKYAVEITNNGTMLTSISAIDIPRLLPVDTARQYLLGAIVLEVAVILLIVTNAAASTVTREKEDGTLDLLLSTPITSRYYIWGKLRGLVSFVLPLVAVPVISVAIFVVYDAFRFMFNNTSEKWVVLPEAAIILPGTLIIISAFAAILGMQMSLRCRTTVMAVMSSVGIVAGICAALGWCGIAFLDNRAGDGVPGLVFGSFSPFTLLAVLINPYKFAPRAFEDDADVLNMRIVVFVCSWIAIAAYTAIVWTMYRSMVKNFDMTIRRQSR